MRIEIKGKVVAKGRPRFTRTGRPYTPAETKRYETLVKQTARLSMRRPLEAPLSVGIVIHKQPPKSWSMAKKQRAIDGIELPAVKPDIDNYVKAILDGLNGIAYKDDNQIIRLTAEKRYSEEDKAVIEIEEIDTAAE